MCANFGPKFPEEASRLFFAYSLVQDLIAQNLTQALIIITSKTLVLAQCSTDRDEVDMTNANFSTPEYPDLEFSGRSLLWAGRLE